MIETEKAWLAGIIDGEGCISISKRNLGKAKSGRLGFSYRLNVMVRMTHKPTIEKIVSLVGLGKCDRHERDITRKDAFVWSLWTQQAFALLKEILPYMITKRNNAINAIEYVEYVNSLNPHSRGVNGLTDEEWNKYKEYYNKSKELNHVEF